MLEDCVAAREIVSCKIVSRGVSLGVCIDSEQRGTVALTVHHQAAFSAFGGVCSSYVVKT